MNKDKTILITGCATGIGAATAALAKKHGLRVFGFDVREPHNPVHFDQFLYCDLSEPESIDSGVLALPEPIDYLVNSAGLPGSFPVEMIFKVNVLGLVYLSKKILDVMKDNGSIVNVASGAGHLWQQNFDEIMNILAAKGFEDGLAACLAITRDGSESYNFSKEIIIAFTKQFSSHTWSRNINVNCVSPGGVQTQMTPHFRRSMGEIVDWSIGKVGRHAAPEDIAKPIIWLTSNDASWVNGADLVTDGGLLAGIQTGAFDLPGS